MNPALPLTPFTVATFQVGRPLFGSQWLALLLVLGLIAGLLALVALLGRWLAATHPAPPTPVKTATTVAALPSAQNEAAQVAAISAQPTLSGDVPAEVVPVVIAAVAACLGNQARVTSIGPFIVHTAIPSLEALMQQWSYEGRRQIYSSHKVR